MADRVLMVPGWEHHLDGPIARMLANIGDDIADDARRIAPVDTGELRSSIARGPVEGATVRVTASAPHALYVEVGTRHAHAQPYLRPALYRHRDGG